MATCTPGFRSYESICPFCGTHNVISDGTGTIEETKCEHFFLLCQGYFEPDVIFREGRNQKRGIAPSQSKGATANHG